MKYIQILITAGLVLCLAECPVDNAPKSGAVGMSMILHKNSRPGDAGYADSFNLMSSIGVNLFGVTAEWRELEPAPGVFALEEAIEDPLRIVDTNYPEFTDFILVIKTINTYQRVLPPDLAAMPFDGDEALARFGGLIDAIAEISAMRMVTHILVGNEVDVYLSAHPEELDAYAGFLQQAVARIHQKMPWARVGTVFTFNLLAFEPEAFDTLVPHCDFVAYTYYPTEPLNDGFRMRSPEDAAGDILLMAAKAGTLPFALTEIGYAAAETSGSSEANQGQFVEAAFNALRPYKTSGELEFFIYHGLYDFPTEFCSEYAQSQGIDETHLCSFMNSLGLHSYETGLPRQAWSIFVNKLATW